MRLFNLSRTEKIYPNANYALVLTLPTYVTFDPVNKHSKQKFGMVGGGFEGKDPIADTGFELQSPVFCCIPASFLQGVFHSNGNPFYMGW